MKARTRPSDLNSQNALEEARTSSLSRPSNGVVMGFSCCLLFDPGYPSKVKWGMNSYITNPLFFRLKTLLSLEISEVDGLARKAVGSLTSFRLLLGRCLLAMRERKGFKKYGCSSEIHYSVSRLGLSKGVAGDCRRVARDLLGLPDLTLAAEQGAIGWGKLREVSRKASPETEALWLKLCGDLNYKQIEKLVAKTPKGGVPGDVFEQVDERATTEFRCRMSEEVLAMLDRARRMYSLEQDKAVTTVEVLEWALASYISSQPVDEESLEKVRLEMDKDLQAEKAREIPLVAQAREVAAEMGCIPIPRGSEMESGAARAGEASQPDFARAGEVGSVHSDAGSSDFNPDDAWEHRRNQTFARAGTSGNDSLNVETAVLGKCCGSPERTHDCCPHKPDGLELAAARANSEYLEALKDSLSPIQNKRVCFNPRNRHATKAQKREVLRRDGWCCSTPGCPHKIWLHLHHLIPYSHGGPTLPSNVLGICVACHTNVHAGTLKIFLNDRGKLVFTDADGNCLTEQADLMLAGWLDFHEGWYGEREDSYRMRWGRGDWSVFEKSS